MPILKNDGVRQWERIIMDDISYMKWKIKVMFETTNQKYIYIYPLIILHFFEEFLGLSMAKRLAAAFLDKRLPTHYVDY